MNKGGKFFGCFLPILIALFCQIVVSYGFSIAYGVYMAMKVEMLGITGEAEQQAYIAENFSPADVVLVITAIATFITLLVGVLWYRKYKPVNDFKLK